MEHGLYNTEKNIVVTQRDKKDLGRSVWNPRERREHNDNQECDNFDYGNNVENVTNPNDNNSVGKFTIFHQREKEKALILSSEIAS